jgi:hypothetical protein
MQKYRWVKFPRGPLGRDYIYNIEEGCVYEFNWTKRKLRYNPEQGSPFGLYQNQKYIFCTKNNKSTFYYPNINKIEDLSIDIDPERDLISKGDKCFLNGEMFECRFNSSGYYIFYNKEKYLLPKKNDKIIKVKYNRLDKIKKIKSVS